MGENEQEKAKAIQTFVEFVKVVTELKNKIDELIEVIDGKDGLVDNLKYDIQVNAQVRDLLICILQKIENSPLFSFSQAYSQIASFLDKIKRK